MKGMQFSLRTLLAAVAVVGIGAALWVARPSWQVGAVEALLVVWVLFGNIEMPKERHRSLRIFAFYATLTCISLAALQAVTANYDPERNRNITSSLLLMLVSSAMIGATMGCICGKTISGTLIGLALFSCFLWFLPHLVSSVLHGNAP